MENQFIQEVDHQPLKPVTVERDGDDLIVEGVRYAGDLFRGFAEPDDKYLYAIRRDPAEGAGGDVVTLVTVHNIEEAEKFFAEVKDGTN